MEKYIFDMFAGGIPGMTKENIGEVWSAYKNQEYHLQPKDMASILGISDSRNFWGWSPARDAADLMNITIKMFDEAGDSFFSIALYSDLMASESRSALLLHPGMYCLMTGALNGNELFVRSQGQQLPEAKDPQFNEASRLDMVEKAERLGMSVDGNGQLIGSGNNYSVNVGAGVSVPPAPAIEATVPEGYTQDANGQWHRLNGQFASNAEVGLSAEQPAQSNGVHGNSLNHPGTNYGYALVDKDTGEILKFGETLYPDTRYSKTYLESINARMDILTSGSKVEIHFWQHTQIDVYVQVNGSLPPLNKTGW